MAAPTMFLFSEAKSRIEHIIAMAVSFWTPSTYQKLQKDKSFWYCICCFWKELPCGSTTDTQLKNLLHEEVAISPNPKIISSIIKQSEYLDEDFLSKTNNKFYTADELAMLKKLEHGISVYFYAP